MGKNKWECMGMGNHTGKAPKDAQRRLKIAARGILTGYRKCVWLSYITELNKTTFILFNHICVLISAPLWGAVFCAVRHEQNSHCCSIRIAEVVLGRGTSTRPVALWWLSSIWERVWRLFTHAPFFSREVLHSKRLFSHAPGKSESTGLLTDALLWDISRRKELPWLTLWSCWQRFADLQKFQGGNTDPLSLWDLHKENGCSFVQSHGDCENVN